MTTAANVFRNPSAAFLVAPAAAAVALIVAIAVLAADQGVRTTANW